MMMNPFLFLSLLWVPTDTVSLDDLHAAAREQWPLYHNIRVYEEIHSLNLDDLSARWYPEIALAAQLQYQSEVTVLDIPLPGVEVPGMPRDQYGMALELRQQLWDGGATARKKELMQWQVQSDRQEVLVELYRMRDELNELFFSALMIQYRIESMLLLQQELENRYREVLAGYESGLHLRSTRDLLRVEQLGVKRMILEQHHQRESVIQVINELTGMMLAGDTYLTPPLEYTTEERPEFAWFETGRSLVAAQSAITDTRYLPSVYLVGQAGVARPGLNMFNDTFSPFYIAGIQARWNMRYPSARQREKELLRYRLRLIDHQQEYFEQRQRIALIQQQSIKDRVEEQLRMDAEILELRIQVAEEYGRRLSGGQITPADYLAAVHAVHRARLDQRMGELKRLQTAVSIRTILGEEP